MTCALFAPRVQATEGGAGNVIPGAKITLIDLLPTEPGWVLEAMYLHYDGSAEGFRLEQR